jgi:hypothetical protein
MKPREQVLRLKRFEVEEKARKVADLELMIQEFERMADDLNRQIVTEEERTGVKDSRHFAYSMFAKAAALRRDNLRTSAGDLKAKLAAAIAERDEARANLAKAEATDSRDVDRLRRRNDRGPDALAS